MSDSHSRAIGYAVLAVLATGFAEAQVATAPDTVPAEERAAAAADPNWQEPRTSWGDPLLEGVYSTDDMQSVPWNRPEAMGTREQLTPEEFVERAKADAETRDRILNRDSYSPFSVGSRTFGWTSQIIDPPDGRQPPLTPAAQARSRPQDLGSYGPGPFDKFEDLSLYDRCITRGVIGSSMAVIYGNGIRVAQSPDSVVISYEMLADSRVIPIDGREHAPANIKQYVGNSRGHWEGDTLVIETTNFNGKTAIGGNGLGVQHSDQMKITERLRRVDPQMIEYTARVEDPVTYSSPFTVRMMWTTQPGYEIFEYSCHEANRAVAGALGGERNYEARVREAQASGRPIPDRLASQPFLDELPNDESVFLNINEGDAGN